MTLQSFRQALAVMNVAANEQEWFPKWVGAYAADSEVKTTMIYTHVMNRPGLAVTSPSDRLALVTLDDPFTALPLSALSLDAP